MTLMADLMLLAVDPEQHRVRASAKVGFALRGAELVELAIAERVGVTDGRIHVLDPAPVGDGRLDLALASLVGARKPPRATPWVQRDADTARRAQIAVLVGEGAIRFEQRPVLRIFHKTVFYVGDLGRRHAIKASVDAIAAGADPQSARDRALAGLVGACGLSGALYPGSAGKAQRDRLKTAARRDELTAQVLSATDAAIRSATDAAVDAAVDAALDAAVHAAVDAAHHAAASGHDGGGGGGGHH